jgi:uncharacterized protein
MEVDTSGLEVLGRSACLELLGTTVVGRIGITSGAMPTILPVTYRLVDGEVFIRTGRGTSLDAATRDAVVAFEADDVDGTTRTGWSVTATGIAREAPDGHLDHLDVGPLARWAPSGDGRLIAVSLRVISGRRLLGG